MRGYGRRPAGITRRILSLTAAAVVPTAATAVLALATPAQASEAQASGLSVVIDSISPQTAGPGATVTVSGTVSNGTSRTQAGLTVQLWTSAERFLTRDAMDTFVNHGTGADLGEVGNPFSITASLRPGATVA